MDHHWGSCSGSMSFIEDLKNQANFSKENI